MLRKDAPRKARTVLVLGEAEQGKTYWARGLVASLPREHLALCWDPNVEFHQVPGAVVVPDARAAARVLTVSAPSTLVVQDTSEEGFCDFAELAHGLRGATVVIDELHSYAPHSLTTGKRPGRHLLDGIRKRRHLRLNWVLISQRPKTIHVDCQNADRFVLFRDSGDSTYEWARGKFGKDLAEQIRRLKPWRPLFR